MIYYAIILVLFACSLLYQLDEKKKFFGVLSTICVLGIVFFGGLRNDVGQDWSQYQLLYERTTTFQSALEGPHEKTFMLLIYFFRSITANFNVFAFFFFLVSLLLKYRVFRTYTSDVFLSLIIYCFTVLMIYDLNGIRQGMAIGIVLLSIKPILERKFIPFALIITLAILMHTSAIIFIPFYWLSRIQFSDKSIWWITIGLLLIAVPIRFILEKAPLIMNLVQLEAFTHYNYYLDNDESGRSLPLISIAVFQRLFILFSFLYFLKDIPVDKRFKQLLFNGYLVSILVYLILSFNAEFSARLSFYYKSLEMLIIPLVVSAISDKRLTVVFLCIFVILALFGVNRLLAIPNGALLPYHNVLW
jgi:hypothetical protein